MINLRPHPYPLLTTIWAPSESAKQSFFQITLVANVSFYNRDQFGLAFTARLNVSM